MLDLLSGLLIQFLKQVITRLEILVLKSWGLPKSKLYFIVSQMNVIVKREDSFSVDGREREKPIVEAVAPCTHHLMEEQSTDRLNTAVWLAHFCM